MIISVKCPREDCGISFSVGEHYAGQKTRCPECNAVVNVPSMTSTPTSSPSPASAEKKRGTEMVLLGIILLVVVASVAYFAGSILERTDSLSRQTTTHKNRIAELELEVNTLRAEREAFALERKKLKETSNHFEKLFGELSQQHQKRVLMQEEAEAKLDLLTKAEQEARKKERALRADNESAKTEFGKKEAAWEELLQSEKAIRERYVSAFREEQEFPKPDKASTADIIKALDKEKAPLILKGLPIHDLRKLLTDYATDKNAADKRYRATRAVVVANTLGVGKTEKGLMYAVMVPRDMQRATPARAYLLPGTETDAVNVKSGDKFIAVGWLRGSFDKIIYFTDCQRVKTDYILREIQRRKAEQGNAIERSGFDALETLILSR